MNEPLSGQEQPGEAREASGEPAVTAAYRSPLTALAPAELARHFPHLEVLELLGQGGMGTVYRARQLKLDRLVALKILSPQAELAPHFAERFLREARTLARLNHPGIVAVHDFGEAEGLFFFLMEYVAGANLRERMRKGPLPLPELLAILAQIGDALQFAHEEGIIHRDIKPENILLDHRGRVKIADFGLAKLLGQTTASHLLTASHQIMGTPYYMAPEQWEKPLTVDHRADIYSLGVVLYELLTGELPLGHFAPPSQKAAVDPRFDEVILRAMQKDPERRYQQVADFKAAVEAIARQAPSQPLPSQELPFREQKTEAAPPADRRATHWPADTLLAGEGAPDLGTVEKQVLGPAMGLMLSSVLSLAGLPLGLLGLPLGVATAVALLGLPLGLTILLGAVQMRRLRAYELAVASSILAMLPLTLGWFIGLPLGLWAFLVLRRPEVKAAFAARTLQPAPPFPWRLGLWAFLVLRKPVVTSTTEWVLLLCAFGMAGSFLPWLWLSWSEEVRGPGWGSNSEVWVNGLATWHGVAILVLFALPLAVVSTGSFWPAVRRRRLGRVLGQTGKVVMGLVGLLLATWTGLVWFLESHPPLDQRAHLLAFLVLGISLFAVPLVPNIAWRSMLLLLCGWGIISLAGLYIALVVLNKVGSSLPPDVPHRLRSADHFQFHWLAKEPTLGPGPVCALVLALGLEFLGLWQIKTAAAQRREKKDLAGG